MGWLALALVVAFVLYKIIDKESLSVGVLAMLALLPVLAFQSLGFEKSTALILTVIILMLAGALFNSAKE